MDTLYHIITDMQIIYYIITDMQTLYHLHTYLVHHFSSFLSCMWHSFMSFSISTKL